MKIIAFFIIAFGIAVMLTSCSKTKQNSPVPSGDSLEPIVRLVKVVTGEDMVDHYYYNSEGTLLQHTSGDTHPMPGAGTDDVIAYDASHRISQITRNDLYMTKFIYRGDTLDRAEEYDHKMRLAVTHSYRFVNNKLIELLDKVHSEVGPDFYIKTSYSYWPNGNVSLAHTSMTQPGGKVFTDWHLTQYEHYDKNPNPEPGIFSYPFIPTSKLFINNPGRITIKNLQNGSITSVQTNVLEYNEEGYPFQRIQTMIADGKEYKTTLHYTYLTFAGKSPMHDN